MSKAPRPKAERIVLIDANALIHRGFHALPPTLRTTKGVLVNGVYGFTSTLLNVLRELKPQYAAAAFDLNKKTFRHKMYEDYKATRVAAPQELYDQIPIVKDVVRAMNMPILEQSGYEADDMIGMADALMDVLAKKRGTPIEVIIVTGDKDALQLIDGNTKVYTMRRGFTDTLIYDAEKFRAEYGFGPELMIDYKALRGDPSDNIPGVPGIGDKTARQLICGFGSIDALYAKLAKLDGDVLSAKGVVIKGKTLERLKTYKEQAYLSKRLATIVREPKVKLTLEAAAVHDFDRQKVVDLFHELQFKSLLKRLPDAPQEHATKPGRTLFDVMRERGEDVAKNFTARNKAAHYTTVDDEKKLSALVAKLKKAKLFAFDTETTALGAMTAGLVGLSFAVKAKEAFYIPVGHREGKQLAKAKVLEVLKPLLEDAKYKKIGHNYKFDWLVLRNHGVHMSGPFFDTLLAPYVLEPGSRGLDLDSVAFSELGYEMMPIDALIGSGSKQKSFAETPIEGATFYAAEDADITFRLYEAFSKQLAKRPDAKKIFETEEIPLVPVLGQMEFNGIEIDPAALKRVSTSFSKRIDALTRKIYKISGIEFNINSSQQLADILFDRLQLSTLDIKKTQKGFSTAASELVKLRGNKIVDYIQEYRELTKLKNTYLDALPKLVNPKTGRLHTTYNQTIAATGRLSSTDPNLQNIPVRTPQGQQIREGFHARKGWHLLALDYSQIELRIMAHLSKSPRFVEAFENDTDIHRAVAAAVHGVYPEDVTDEQRREAKIVNFAILYGVSAYGLAQQTSMDVHQAKEYIERYFELNPEVRSLLDGIKMQARTQGYTETIFGRRRYFPDIESTNPVIRGAAERAAINMPFQGTNADIMKLAMIKIFDEIPYLRDKMLLQVHDELIFELPPKEVKQYAKRIREIMEGIVTLEVPLKVDVEVGEHWNGLEKVKL